MTMSQDVSQIVGREVFYRGEKARVLREVPDKRSKTRYFVIVFVDRVGNQQQIVSDGEIVCEPCILQ